MKKKVKRLWIRDIRIPFSRDNKIIQDTWEEWRSDRTRPKHFTLAMKLYISLLSNDIDGFLDVLFEVAPTIARKLMSSQLSAPPTPVVTAPKVERVAPKAPPPPPPVIAQQSSTESALLDSLGIDFDA